MTVSNLPQRQRNPYREIRYRELIGQLKRDGFLSPLELAEVVEGGAHGALDSKVQSYLVAFLRGEIKTKRGPKPKISFSDRFYNALEEVEYEYALEKFRQFAARRKRRGQKAAIPRHTGATPSPHQRAAEHVSRYLYRGRISAATILNRRSLRKKKRS